MPPMPSLQIAPYRSGEDNAPDFARTGAGSGAKTAVAAAPVTPPLTTPLTNPLADVAAIVTTDLAPLVRAIDEENFYPGAVLRKLGAAGCYSGHVTSLAGTAPDLSTTIRATALAGQECLSTAFCLWCQATFAWYADNTDNAALKARYAQRAADGQILGGTGLSNPMKAFFGIEKLRLKAKRVAGGYSVKGVLPWVSNLGPDHVFGTIFEVEGEAGSPPRRVMAMIPCDHPGVTLVDAGAHLALDGTGTYAVQIRDAIITDDLILADPAEPFVKKVRQGFILLQMGMAFGVIRGCIDIQEQQRASLGHVNCYLDDQPEQLTAELAALETETFRLAQTPYDESNGRWRRVIENRLAGSELSLRAANAAMLFSGARGYVRAGAAQRRLREAYFVAIVTPAIKQLKKMLSDLDGVQPSH